MTFRFVFFNIQDLSKPYNGPFHFVQIYGTNAILNYRQPGGTTDTKLATKAIPAAYSASNSFKIRLVVNKKHVDYYLGDMNKPLISAELSTEFAGGALNLKSRAATLTYTDVKVTYNTATTTTMNDLSKWNKSGTAASYLQYVLPEKLAEDNFTLQYTLNYVSGNKWYWVDFGIQDVTKAYQGPYYYVHFNASNITLQSRSSTGTDTELAKVTTPTGIFTKTTFQAKLVVDKTSVSFYLDDMTTPVLTCTLASAYEGGSINIKSNKTDVTYADMTLSYVSKQQVVWNNFSDWADYGDFANYREYVSPASLNSDNFVMEYDALVSGEKTVIIDFGLSGDAGNRYSGPFYFLWMDAAVVKLQLRNAANQDTLLATKTMTDAYTDSAYHVKIAVKGKDVKVDINGTSVLSYTLEEAYKGGYFNVKTRKSPVEITNFSVTSERAAGNTDPIVSTTTTTTTTTASTASTTKKPLPTTTATNTDPHAGRYLHSLNDQMSSLAAWKHVEAGVYNQYISSTALESDNFIFEYDITTTAGDGVNIIDFSIPNLNMFTAGPLYLIRMDKGNAQLYSRNADNVDSMVTSGPMPDGYDYTKYSVKLVVQQKNVYFFVNGTLTLVYEMSEPFKGGGFNLKTRATTSTYTNINVSYYSDTAPTTTTVPTPPVINKPIEWKAYQNLNALEDWEYIGSATSTYREYISPGKVNETNFVLEVDIEYLMGDGQYYIDFGLPYSTSDDRAKGPFYSVMFSKTKIFLYYRESDTDAIVKSWNMPENFNMDLFHVKLAVDQNYMALYLGETDTPTAESMLDHSYTGGGFNLKVRNTYALYDGLSIKSYVDEGTLTETTPLQPTEEAGESPSTGAHGNHASLLFLTAAVGAVLILTRKKK